MFIMMPFIMSLCYACCIFVNMLFCDRDPLIYSCKFGCGYPKHS